MLTLIMIILDNTNLDAATLSGYKSFLFFFSSFQLPRMLETDAIARYYGLEKGQVVKITCSGGLVDSLVTYRCVK